MIARSGVGAEASHASNHFDSLLIWLRFVCHWVLLGIGHWVLQILVPAIAQQE
jgi:hypothetical protein